MYTEFFMITWKRSNLSNRSGVSEFISLPLSLQLIYGLRTEAFLSHRVMAHGTHVRINALIPGSDYEFEIQSFLGEDFSQSVSKNISTSKSYTIIQLLVLKGGSVIKAS